MNHQDETIDGSDSARNPLELLAADFSAARRRGEQPSIEEYINRVPDQRDEARALLESLALFERVSERETTRQASQRRHKKFEHTQIEQLGDFRVLREIGRGGMGIIYEAEQITLKRRVALKVLSSQTRESAKQLERFQREAEAVARLHHTNIVPVFGSGSQDGVHYFAMQLIDGEPLSKLPALSFAAIARLGMQAASALAYAHSHGVLHRDVKPSNLLLDRSGEVWVTDFGLAKLSDVGELTQTGDIMGTLKYMAPEQLEGRADERTDIYSLGLTLYELVTGQPAFDLSTSLKNRIRNHEFPAPRAVKPEIPRDLETIILKATASEPQHRYGSASAMADDLRNYLEDRPIAARRVTSLERFGRWTRRNPALAVSTLSALVLLAATTIVTSWGYVTTRAALHAAKIARDDAFSAGQEADQSRRRAVLSQARAEGNLNVALQAFDAIFDNVAQRGVPQSLSQDMQQAASADEDSPNEGASKANKESSASYEVTLSSADAELLNNLLKFYSKFADENGDDAALQTRTAQAYQRIGQIQLRLGKSAEALASYRSAIALLEKIDAERPNDAQVVLATAKVYNDLGLALSTLSRDVGQIVSHHKAAIALLNGQSKSMVAQPETRFELARAYDLAGSILGRSGASNLDDMVNPPGAGGMRPPGWLRFGFMEPPRQRMPLDERFAADGRRPPPPPQSPPQQPPQQPPNRDGKNFLMRRDGARGPGPLGMGGPGMGGPMGPRMNLQAMIDEDLFRGRDLLAALCAEFPERDDYLLAYATSQRHLMLHFVTTNRLPEATDAFAKAREALDALIARKPSDPKVLLELADTLSTASARLGGLDASQSEDYLRQSTTTCQKLCEAFPSVPEYQALLATCQDRLGMLEQSKQHWESADAAYRSAIERLQNLLERFPNDRFYQLSLLQAATHLAELRMIPQAERNQLPDLNQARQWLEQAIEPCKVGRVSRSALERAERALRAVKK